MADHSVATVGHPPTTVKKLETVGWGLFFIWLGIALLAHLSWGIALLGVGALTLIGQVVRKGMGLRIETFWTVLGTLFVIGGAWLLLGVEVNLLPVICILAGVALFLSALLHKPREQ